jgi:hypothetical protein
MKPRHVRKPYIGLPSGKSIMDCRVKPGNDSVTI